MRKRIGFTLVELLVVIAIIAILAGLGAWGVFAMIGRTHARNTESTMKVVNKLLFDRWSAVIADAKKETISPATHVNLFMLANGDLERARVIWIKVRLMEAFPVKYAEVLPPASPPNPLSVLATYIPAGKQKPHFAKYQALLAGKVGGGPGESSACLLMALKTLASDGVSVEDQLSYAVADTDGDGMKELIDGWGKPLAFFRFPTGANLQAVNPAAAASTAFKHSDPTDPGGTLLNPGWYNKPIPALPAMPYWKIFEGQFHTIARDNTPHACYMIPVIVSAGKDGIMDLDAIANPSGPGAADNIFSFTLRGD